jgi:hypothetical protein
MTHKNFNKNRFLKFLEAPSVAGADQVVSAHASVKRCEKIKNKGKNSPAQQGWAVWKTLERNLIERN